MKTRRNLLLIVMTSALGVGGWLWQRGACKVSVTTTPDHAAWPEARPALDDWPWWRGPRGNGIAEGNPPVEWSLANAASNAGKNIAWRTAVPGRGHASPVVWGPCLCLLTADEAQQTVSLLCFDRATGAPSWSCEVQRGGLPKINQKNSHASATPACDGVQIYAPCVANGRLWVTAVTMAGQIAWKVDAGPYQSEEGYGASPVLHEGFVIVAADSAGSLADRLSGSAFVAALDRRTGQIAWRTKRPSKNSYGGPALGEVAGRKQLLLAGCKKITAYDPSTGKEVWDCPWGADRTAGTPTCDGNRFFLSATIWNNEIVCLRGAPDLAADVARLQWSVKQGAADVPSPLVVGDKLYVVNDGGVLTCISANEGRVHWKKRLRGNFSASPVAAAGRVYLTNEEGLTFVVSEQGKILAENSLPEPTFASPALCGDSVFLRTSAAVYCIQAHPDRPESNAVEHAKRDHPPRH